MLGSTRGSRDTRHKEDGEMKRIAFALLGLVSLGVAPARGGVVAPSKPSEIAVLDVTQAVTPACTAILARTIDTAYRSTGAVEPFSVPDGQVFVITTADFYSELGLPDRAYELQLVRVGTGFILNGNARSDSTGQVIGAVTVPSGVVVKPGSVLCARISSQTSATFPSYARLHGFFTKDK